MLAEFLQSEGSQPWDGIWWRMPDLGFHFVAFRKLEVPKMWENSPLFFSPLLQFSAPPLFFFGGGGGVTLIPTFKVKSQYSWFLMLVLILW